MIYFIREGSDGPIKIGYSKNVAERLSTLQTSTAHPLHLLGTIEGSQYDEHRLHAKFDTLRIKGEWFQPDPALLAFISEESQPGVKQKKKRRAPSFRVRRPVIHVVKAAPIVAHPPARIESVDRKTQRQQQAVKHYNRMRLILSFMLTYQRWALIITWLIAVYILVEVRFPTMTWSTFVTPRLLLQTLGVEALIIVLMMLSHRRLERETQEAWATVQYTL